MQKKFVCDGGYCDLCRECVEKVFQSVNLAKGMVYNRKMLDRTFLLTVSEGEMSVNYTYGRKIQLKAGEMLLLPKNMRTEFTAIKDCRYVLCTLQSNMNICHFFTSENLEAYLNEYPTIRTTIEKEKRLYSLPAKKSILQFIHTLEVGLHSKVNCTHFTRIKREEIFLYLRAEYTLEKLAFFFYPILSGKSNFKDFIFEHYVNAPNVSELANLAGMSQRNFVRKFKEAFQESPQKWLQARKADAIYYDVRHTELSFAEISNKYDFSSPSYFANYCKRQWGVTASELRSSSEDR